jgi:uncharacterized protein YciI
MTKGKLLAEQRKTRVFIISTFFKKPIEEVDRYLPEHIAYLDKFHAAGVFICSGRKNPRTGGCILAKAPDRESVLNAIKEDPFYQEGIADYEITEFSPTKYVETFRPIAEG